jgi:sugar (pentulose or hexulose) kinase
MSDILGVNVYTADLENSAALGAAYRAYHGLICRESGRFINFADAVTDAPGFELAARPDKSLQPVYEEMLARYENLEKRLIVQS